MSFTDLTPDEELSIEKCDDILSSNRQFDLFVEITLDEISCHVFDYDDGYIEISCQIGKVNSTIEYLLKHEQLRKLDVNYVECIRENPFVEFVYIPDTVTDIQQIINKLPHAKINVMVHDLQKVYENVISNMHIGRITYVPSGIRKNVHLFGFISNSRKLSQLAHILATCEQYPDVLEKLVKLFTSN